jgi:hypothetical protein
LQQCAAAKRDLCRGGGRGYERGESSPAQRDDATLGATGGAGAGKGAARARELVGPEQGQRHVQPVEYRLESQA